MSIASIVQNIELERANNQELGEKIDKRETSEIAADRLELSQLEALVEEKRRRLHERVSRADTIKAEFKSRDAALVALIEGDAN